MIKNKISVIMASYNHAPYVKQAIESVLKQEGIDFEFLIADDGSTDETREIISNIKDPRITFFPHLINRGACLVTNELIELCSGEFIALINSDDYWVIDKLKYQLKILQDNPELGACFSSVNFVDKDGKVIDKTKLPFGFVFDQENKTQGRWLRYFFDNGNCLCHPSILVRKQAYNEIGFFSNQLRQLPDFDMWIRLIKKYPIFISNIPLINFRILPGENASSQTSKNSTRTLNEHFLIAETFFDNITVEIFVDAFSDILTSSKITNIEIFEIEKTLVFFNNNQWLNAPYKMIGLLKLNKLLSNINYRNILKKIYNIDDLWFHEMMSNIETLRPKTFAEGVLTYKQRSILTKIKIFIKNLIKN